jgi:Fe-S cluster assembly ATP-binding protein
MHSSIAPHQNRAAAAARAAAGAPPRLARPLPALRAAATAEASPAASAPTVPKGEVMLRVEGLCARVAATGKEILKGVDLEVRAGEIHAVMGKNGSGKSTLSKVLVGHPDYEVTAGSATFKGLDLFSLEPEERSHAGLFLSFQSPVEVPGVSNVDFLRLARNALLKARGQPELDPLEFYAEVAPQLEKLRMDPTFLNRNVNEGFSGGEKKRNEILQLAVLGADLAVLDEVRAALLFFAPAPRALAVFSAPG